MEPLRSIRWNLFGSTFFAILQLLFGILLARMIAPEHFGTFALLIALPSVFNAFLFFLFKNLLIQSSAPKNILRSSGRIYHKLLRIFSCILLGLSILCISLDVLPKSLLTTTILILLALEFFGRFGYKQIAFELEGKFKEINQFQLFAGLLSNLIALLLAFYGLELLALAWRYVLHYFIQFLFYHSTKYPLIESLKPEVLSSAIKTIGVYQIVEILGRYFDDVLIGLLMGTQILAYYGKSYQLFVKPTELIVQKTFDVLLPSIAQQKIPTHSTLFIRTFLSLQVHLIPLLLFIAFCSREIVELVLGDNWAPAHIAIFWFIMANIFNFHSLSSYLLLAAKKNQLLRKIGLIKNLMILIAIAMGCFFDLRILLIAFFIASFGSSLYALYCLYQDQIIHVKPFIQVVLLPILMVSIFIMASMVLQPRSLSDPQIWTYAGLSGVLVLFGHFVMRKYILDTLKQIKKLNHAT